MDTHLLHDLSGLVVEIAQKASESIMDVYLSETVAIRVKKDGSPVTEADINSHKIIIQELKKLPSRFPILSEEGGLVAVDTKEKFWLIDPLDGTKEFINKNDEFTVNIALIENGRPVLGVINAPALKKAYLGILGKGSYKVTDGAFHSIYPKKIENDILRITLSRSHPSNSETQFVNKMSKFFRKVEIIRTGSSLKLCTVAEGGADIYCRLGPTHQWDIASGQAIVESVGGFVVDKNLKPLNYTYDLKRKNPNFFCVPDLSNLWKEIITQSYT